LQQKTSIRIIVAKLKRGWPSKSSLSRRSAPNDGPSSRLESSGFFYANNDFKRFTFYL